MSRSNALQVVKSTDYQRKSKDPRKAIVALYSMVPSLNSWPLPCDQNHIMTSLGSRPPWDPISIKITKKYVLQLHVEKVKVNPG
jgi:hypothetical protein